MQLASEFAAALITAGTKEWYVVARQSDLGRLHRGGFLERAWQLKLDNGHRPYAVPLKTIYFPVNEQATDLVKNQLTQDISVATGIKFAADFHQVTDTCLFRKTAAFWAELLVDFAEQTTPQTEGYYAVYRGVVQPVNQNIKFSRLA